MKKKLSVLILFILCFLGHISYAESFQVGNNLFSPGINFGIGLPKVPIGRYHTPVAICGGILTYVHITHRIAIQASGNALYTFNLGSVLKKTSKLRFNLIWGNVCFNYKVKKAVNKESYFSPGIGYYSLFQQFDYDKNDLTTSGFNLGIVTHTYRKNIISQFEIRWHLLFNPEPKPQVLTVKFGFLF